MNHLKGVFFISGVQMVLWGKDVNSKILTGPMSVSFALLSPLILMLTVPFPQLLVSG